MAHWTYELSKWKYQAGLKDDPKPEPLYPYKFAPDVTPPVTTGTLAPLTMAANSTKLPGR